MARVVYAVSVSVDSYFVNAQSHVASVLQMTIAMVAELVVRIATDDSPLLP